MRVPTSANLAHIVISWMTHSTRVWFGGASAMANQNAILSTKSCTKEMKKSMEHM